MRVKTLWTRIVNAGTEGMKVYDPNLGICKGINLLSLWIILINIIVGPLFYLASGKISVLYGSIFEALFLVGLIALNYYKKYVFANILFYLILNAATAYFSTILGQSAEAQLMIVFLVGLTLFIFNKLAIRIVCITTTIILLVAMEMNFKYKLFHQVEASGHIRDYMRWAAYAVIIFLVAILFYLYARNTDKLLLNLKDYSKNIETNLTKEMISNQKKSKFIRNAYHEIRGHFWGVFVIIKILSKAQNQQEIKNIGKVLFDLNNGCQNLQMILSNILEYSKYDAGIMEKPLYEPVNLQLLISGLVDISRYAANEKSITIEYSTFGDIPSYIVCDRLKLTQVITNLMNNAVKFSKPNSSILIRLERENDSWKISIKDQGKGISPDRLKYIFDPFISERNSESNMEGVGLGLHITKHLVSILNGQISVSSAVDVGSCFIIHLPVLESMPVNGTLNNHYMEAFM